MQNFDDEFDDGLPTSQPTGEADPRRLTGRSVLFMLLGFFGIIFAVNGVLIDAAISTFGGVETDSAYQAGRAYEREAALAQQQAARQWQVDAKVTPGADGTARLDIDARDSAGRPIAGLDATATFERPTDRRLDRAVMVAADAPGRFHGNAAVAAGQWDLVIELSRQGDRQFRSVNRIVLK